MEQLEWALRDLTVSSNKLKADTQVAAKFSALKVKRDEKIGLDWKEHMYFSGGLSELGLFSDPP